MADSGKTLRQVLLGKIHRAVVTRADLDYVGSITIDQTLIEAAGFLLNEKVDIYDVTNGSRLSTYVIAAPAGSGEIGINGAAAHLVKPGDLVIITAYGWMKEKAARKHEPQIVLVDDENRQTNIVHEEHNPVQDPFGHLAETAEQEGDDDQDEDEDDEVDAELVEEAPAEKAAPEPKSKKKPKKAKKKK
jgi:aspartate 1-decarboxylase